MQSNGPGCCSTHFEVQSASPCVVFEVTCWVMSLSLVPGSTCLAWHSSPDPTHNQKALMLKHSSKHIRSEQKWESIEEMLPSGQRHVVGKVLMNVEHLHVQLLSMA